MDEENPSPDFKNFELFKNFQEEKTESNPPLVKPLFSNSNAQVPEYSNDRGSNNFDTFKRFDFEMKAPNNSKKTYFQPQKISSFSEKNEQLFEDDESIQSGQMMEELTNPYENDEFKPGSVVFSQNGSRIPLDYTTDGENEVNSSYF